MYKISQLREIFLPYIYLRQCTSEMNDQLIQQIVNITAPSSSIETRVCRKQEKKRYRPSFIATLFFMTGSLDQILPRERRRASCVYQRSQLVESLANSFSAKSANVRAHARFFFSSVTRRSFYVETDSVADRTSGFSGRPTFNVTGPSRFRVYVKAYLLIGDETGVIFRDLSIPRVYLKIF